MGATAKKQKREEFRKKAAAASSAEETGTFKLPQKKYYRQRAHANPFSDHALNYPLSPAHMDWASHFPAFLNSDPKQTNAAGARKLLKEVEVVDIGCGFGGLLVGLAPVLPDTLMVGMEIRVQVTEYLTNRISALRAQQAHLLATSSSSSASTPIPTATPTPAPTADSSTPSTTTQDTPDDAESFPTTLIPGGYKNITAIRANTMKFLPNFFGKAQLSKIFICFPDPHFKARKHKARIVSETLNAEYAFALREGGLLYTITDVEEYHYWILRHFGYGDGSAPAPASGEGEDVKMEGVDGEEVREGSSELFERVSEEELERDECVRVMKEATEEGKKVARNKGNKYVAVFRRKANPEWV
ncbi:putative methyltransferase-domain-containing protein [Aspergillus venezuelensis]